MNVVVLAGGLSPERDVSLSSGSLIANALMERGHRVLLLDLYLGLPDVADFESALLQHGQPRYAYTVPEAEPDLKALVRQREGRETLMGPGVLQICQGAQMVFIALHGGAGENGQLQAALDCVGVRYSGTGYAGSLLAMDKVLSKVLMQAAGIPTPEWQAIRLGAQGRPNTEITLPLPLFVKPCGCGSSVGVSQVETADGMKEALQTAGKYEAELLLERKVEGREFTVGVLEKTALPVIEIIPKQGFFNYKNKYQPGMTEEICPALISGRTTRELQRMALEVHSVLRLGSYSRVDFMMDKNENVFCLEANTLPGMTPTSLLPRAAAAAGIDYAELCERILNLA